MIALQCADSGDWGDFVGVATGLASLVVAFAALRASRRYTDLTGAMLDVSRSQALTAEQVSELFEILRLARTVRTQYHELCGAFGSVAKKTAARGQWLQSQEEVADRLLVLQGIFPKLEPVATAWSVIEDVIDPAVESDQVSPADAKAANHAVKYYDKAHQAFVATVRAYLADLQKGAA